MEFSVCDLRPRETFALGAQSLICAAESVVFNYLCVYTVTIISAIYLVIENEPVHNLI